MARASKAAPAEATKAAAKAPAKSAVKAAKPVAKVAEKAVAKKAAEKAPAKRAAAKAKAVEASAAPKPAAKAAAPAKASKAAAPAPEAKPAKPRKSPFDKKFLEEMRKLLHVERDTYERQARQLKAEADSLVADIEPGDVQFDEESGEGDTIAVERGRDLALSARALEMIEEIDHALTKFELGTYGICEISGDPIPAERLEAIPWARERVEYKVGGFGRR